MGAQRKNIFLNETMADQLKNLRDKIMKESGLRVSEQDLIRSAIDVYIFAACHHVELNTIATVGGVDRAVLELIKAGSAAASTADGSQAP